MTSIVGVGVGLDLALKGTGRSLEGVDLQYIPAKCD